MTTPHVAVILGDPRVPYPYAVGGFFADDELEGAARLADALATLDGWRFTALDDHRTLLADLASGDFDLALNLCDTGFNNRWELEACIPAYLELIGLPYTGAPSAAIARANDKALVGAAAEMLGIPVPEQRFIDLTAEEPALPERYPAILKPNLACGSFGITESSVVADRPEARTYLEWLAPRLEVPEALAQEFLDGEEYTVGLIGNPETGFAVLPPLSINYDDLDSGLPQILTYASKADPDSPYWKDLSFHRSELSPALLERMSDDCERLFRRLGFRDYARFDFRAGADGVPRMLDANTNPTWYENGKMALMASWAGISYPRMLEMILEAALARLRAAPGGSSPPTP